MDLGRTYSAHFIQIVFSVKRRQRLLSPLWENELYLYIAGIIKNRGNDPIAINGMPDHIHILLRMSTQESVDGLVREIKKASTKFIRKRLPLNKVFYWQRGYGVISYNRRDLKMIERYIINQKEHHVTQTLKTEFQSMINAGASKL